MDKGFPDNVHGPLYSPERLADFRRALRSNRLRRIVAGRWGVRTQVGRLANQGAPSPETAHWQWKGGGQFW